MVKYIAGIVVLMFCGDFASAQFPRDCVDFKVKATTIHSTEGKDNGKITLTFLEQDKKSDYRIFLFGAGWEKPQTGSTEGFKDLKAGVYDIYLIDKKGCSKQFNLQVK
jgi:hypothetical protein